MHILIILEKAKFSKEKMIAYHGTHIKHMHSILKNGLLKNHGNEGLGRGEYSNLGFSFEPHDGVYATSLFLKAHNFAKEVAGENNALIVVLEIQPKSIYLDEDEIFSILSLSENEILRHLNEIRYIENAYELDEKANKLIDYFHAKTMNNIPKMLNKYKVNDQTIKYIIQHANKPVRSMIRIIIDSYLDGDEPDIRSEQETLLKLFKHAVRYDNDSLNVFQIPSNIGFKGANKIIGLIYPYNKKAWGKIIPTKYEKVKNPKELI